MKTRIKTKIYDGMEVPVLTKLNPCYDCGSTIEGHHTPKCEFAVEGDVLDLPEIEGTQWWDDPDDH